MEAPDWDSVSDLSSPLSSIGSLSPSPPDFYPSPPSSQVYHCNSPSPDADDSSITIAEDSSITLGPDGPPPAKKRKLAEPKPRTTQYLDLRSEGPGIEQQGSQMELLMKALRKRRKIVVIAGAGISVSAGVPDFRSSTGLFASLREQHKLKASGKHLFDASVYHTETSTSSFHDMVRSLSHLVRAAEPTSFHHLLARLAQEGRLLRLYSQNVDGIDTSLPPLRTEVPLNRKGPWPKTIQLHGGLEKMVCQKCHHLSEFEPTLFEGPLPPICRECEMLDAVRTTVAGKRSHGIGRLRPRIALYNEHNPDDEAIGAVTTSDLRSRPDAVVVVGTSLKVPGVRRIVREMCAVTRSRRDGIVIWINNGPEPVGREFENCWDLVVRGDCEEVAQYAGLRKWDEEEEPSFQEITKEELAKVKSEQGEVSVVVQSPKKKAQKAQSAGILTPADSPLVGPVGVIKPSSKRHNSEKVINMVQRKDLKAKPNHVGIKTTGSSKSKKPASRSKSAVKKQASTVSSQKIKDAFKVTKTEATVEGREKMLIERPEVILPESAPVLPSVTAMLEGSFNVPVKQPGQFGPGNHTGVSESNEEAASGNSYHLGSHAGRLPPSIAMIVN